VEFKPRRAVIQDEANASEVLGQPLHPENAIDVHVGRESVKESTPRTGQPSNQK
jgi:hypothetical protein